MSFVSVDALVLSFLTPRVSAPVHVSVPEVRPKSFIVARRNGGGALNRVIDVATVTVDAWADRDLAAAGLAEQARAAFLHESLAMPLVSGVEEITGPYSVPDPESKSPRFRFSMRLTIRALRD